MIQSILPCLTDPLLCELFFKNYSKYKKKIDKLLIVANYLPSVDYNIYKSQLNDLICLIKQLDIKNYNIVDIGYGAGSHSVGISSVINEITDPQYHCFFDEQDSFLVNNSFSEKVNLLDNIDLIGCRRIHLIKTEDVNNFNVKYNVKHNGALYTLHLPQFLSNRIIKNIDDICFSQMLLFKIDNISYEKTSIDINNDQVFFDVFQYVNFQVYKKTDKIKIYDYNDWCVSDSIYANKNINFDTKFLYHAQASRCLAFYQLFREITDEEMESFLRQMSLVSYYDLNLNFYYQALEYLKDFKYRDIYINNFNKIKHKINLNKFDCSELIKKII